VAPQDGQLEAAWAGPAQGTPTGTAGVAHQGAGAGAGDCLAHCCGRGPAQLVQMAAVVVRQGVGVVAGDPGPERGGWRVGAGAAALQGAEEAGEGPSGPRAPVPQGGEGALQGTPLPTTHSLSQYTAPQGNGYTWERVQ
jgi:hypothetical protein